MTAFDIQKDKWFVRVNSEEECEAAQTWAFEQGFTWAGKGSFRPDYKNWSGDRGKRAMGFGHHSRTSLGQAPSWWFIENGHHEIKLTFKTQKTVDSVEWPEVESPQQRRLRELEETIEAAQKQIAEIRKEM